MARQLGQRLVLCAGTIIIGHSGVYAGEQFKPGFYSPTGSTTSQVADGWLENGCKTGEPYVADYYHTGADFPRSFDSPVYAIWDGVVAYISTNGWGDGNVAVIVKSKLENGQEFLWLVG